MTVYRMDIVYYFNLKSIQPCTRLIYFLKCTHIYIYLWAFKRDASTRLRSDFIEFRFKLRCT